MKRNLVLALLLTCLAATAGTRATSAGAASAGSATEPSEAGSAAALPAPAEAVEAASPIAPEAGGKESEPAKGVRRNQPIGGVEAGEDGGLQAPSSQDSRASNRQRHRPAGGTSTSPSEGSGGSASPESVFTSTSLLAGASEFTAGSASVPALLLPVYEACGSQYGISWEVLAAINKVETNFGTDLGNSSAGAEGWMQFLPSSWARWGVDGNGDGRKEPGNPVDAICAAARYLAASGGEQHIYRAVFAYNHADWYVQKVLSQAREYESMPENLVASLTALAEGSTFPVKGGGSYSGEEGAVAKIHAPPGSSVVAVAAGTVRSVGRSAALGSYVVLEDAFGDRFVYSNLGGVGAGASIGNGTSVSAGTTLARLGSAGGASYIGFSVRPSGSARIEPGTMLDAWKRGGVGKIYRVAAKDPLAADVSPAQALLMSSGELRRRILGDGRLTLPACERSAIASGRVDRRTMAALEYMTSSGYELAIAKSTCADRVGFTLDVASVDGASVQGHQAAGAKTQALLRRAAGLKGGLGAQSLTTATSAGKASISSVAAQKAVTLDFYPPQKATLVDGRATAPVGAPAAVQAMIAAANQISTTPYVWGGGHGSWISDGYDCSGSVSYVLHAAEMLSMPLTSGALESWGSSGSGRWVTVYANATHTYAVIAGLRWDTVGDASGTGPRWHDAPAYPEGFVVRHPTGL
jgi:membrane-bound lytic murein transglycosylase B/cell wall-associated NlpC family hydrolase